MKLTTLVLLLAVFLSACAQAAPTPTSVPTQTPVPLPTGVRPLDPPVALPDFRLTDGRNQPFTRQNLTDRWTLMSFGYTHCPDFCPITLANFTLVRRALGEQAERVAFIFVSVDGARDTPEVLSRYIANFDPTFIGLTGSEMEIRPVTQAFGVRYEIVKPEGTQADYLINHTASSFLVNPKGELARIYSYGTDPEVIAADIRSLIMN